MVDFEGKKKPIFHLDRCVFCYECAESCPKDAITASEIYDMAGFDKNDLLVKPNPSPSEPKEAKR
jgi:formate hydrogenlyase subunit 6/NADH:ubiquinone oxidoreductase subunit I